MVLPDRLVFPAWVVSDKLRNPLFGPKVIIKYGITQCDICLEITHTPTFILMWLETLSVYALGYSTVYLHI